MRAGKSVTWMTTSGRFTEQHPMWKEAYKHEILRQTGLTEKDEEGGYEGLDNLYKRYRREVPPESYDDMREFCRWNMDQIYKRNRILNTKQRLRKKLTDMKRERIEKYYDLVEKLIRNYQQFIVDKEGDNDNEQDLDSDNDNDQENHSSVGFKAPLKTVAQKSPSKSPSKSPIPN